MSDFDTIEILCRVFMLFLKKCTQFYERIFLHPKYRLLIKFGMTHASPKHKTPDNLEYIIEHLYSRKNQSQYIYL